MRFSHPPTEPVRTSTPVRDETAHENLFREPEFAPGTEPIQPEEPVPPQRFGDGRAGNRRPTRRRTAA